MGFPRLVIATQSTPNRPRKNPGVINQDALRASPPAIFTVPEAAVYSTLGERTLWAAISSGKLRARKVGSRSIIRREDLDGFLNGGHAE